MTRSPPKDIGNKQAALDFRTARYPKHILKPNLSGQQRSTASLEEGARSEEPEPNEDEIAIFKRVVQQIVQFHETPSDVAMYSHPRSGISERDETESIISDDDAELALWPSLVHSYISEKRHVELCREDLEQLVKQREELQEKSQKMTMDFFNMTQELKWLDISINIDQTLDTLGLLEEKASRLKQDCLYRGLVDEDGSLIDFPGHVQHYSSMKSIWIEEISEHVKFPMLLVNTASSSRQLRPEPDSIGTPGQYTCTSKNDRINQWLLLSLRSSAINVYQLEGVHREIIGQIETGDSWAEDVLKFWYQDGTDTPTLGESAYAQSLSEGVPVWEEI
jgi:hypothetical protein